MRIKYYAYTLVGGLLLGFVAPLVTSAAALGEQASFSVASEYNTSSRSIVWATLRFEGARAHYYVEDEFWRSLGASQQALLEETAALAQEFDERIHPSERQFFGSEWTPGIDGDSKITILLTPMIDTAGGYFLIGNEFSRTTNFASNEREMLYINSKLNKAARWPEFLAHELQHLITFGAKERRVDHNEAVWLNELRSEYAPTLMGYNDGMPNSGLAQRARSFLRTPEDSLTSWHNENADYAVVTLFGHYLVERFGPDVLTKTVQNDFTGIASVEAALGTLGTSQPFAQVFGNWIKTNFLGGYKNAALTGVRVSPSMLYNVSEAFPVSATRTVEPWGMTSYGLRAASPALAVTLTGRENDSWLLGVIKKNDPGETFITHEFTGSKTIHIATVDEIDKDVILVAVNTTPVVSSDPRGIHEARYTLDIRASNDLVAPQPPPSVTPTTTPTVTPSPTPAPVPPSPPVPEFADGTLIRERGNARVWIVQKGFIRLIRHPNIFNAYRHLRWEDVVDVEPGTPARYSISNLVRAAGGTKVYEIDESGIKRWLNMSAEQFSASSRQWEAVYIVNTQELSFYRLGGDIRQ